MDSTRFDALARALSGLSGHVPSRRALVRALGVGLLGLGAGSVAETGAKKRRKKRRRKKRKCLFGQRRCRDKRCHGCCSDADCGGSVCESGTCSDCPRNQRLCRGGCITEDACCGDGECGGGQVCLEGVCGCGPDRQLCEGVCIADDACCGADCPIDSCTPENCSGCCDGDACRQGDSANFCGREGVACQRCDAGEACDAGVCRGGACSPENCLGCCDAEGQCRDGEGRNFCGRNGASCVQCGRNELCDGEACVCQTACCADADCTAAAGGICQPDGTCEYACVPTDAECVFGVTDCCDPAAFCVSGDTCLICIPSGAACTVDGPFCCDFSQSCLGGFCTI